MIAIFVVQSSYFKKQYEQLKCSRIEKKLHFTELNYILNDAFLRISNTYVSVDEFFAIRCTICLGNHKMALDVCKQLVKL